MNKSIYFFIILIGLLSSLHASLLQDAIDKAPSGSILRLPAGVYKGNFIIDKPLSIIGKEDGVFLDGENFGTIIKISSSFVTLKNLTIINSGERYDKIDAAVSMKKASQCEINHCVIKNCLFGIDMQMVNNSVIANNHISSKNFSLGLRGDGIRLWYSNNNIIKKNSLIKSRDMVVWYSYGNEIFKNYGKDNRYSLHFMHAGKNIIRDNYYENNSVGLFFMYSQDAIVTGNTIKSAQGATGMGIGLKDSSNFLIKDNIIIYCAQGIYNDRSPFELNTTNTISNNKFLYNSEAIHFHSISENSIIKGNIIMGNIEDIVNDSRGSKIYKNKFLHNYWDNYEGFDTNGDGIGDTPHKVFQYADQLWMYHPDIKFFYGSPIISMLNFLAKLAPFTKPRFLFEDKEPKMKQAIVSEG